MSKCLDPFRFLLISVAVWMNQQWPASPARSSRVVVTVATLVSVMNGWRAGGMRRVHGSGVSCLICGVSRTLADSQIPKFRTEMQPLVELGMRRIEFSGHTGYASWESWAGVGRPSWRSGEMRWPPNRQWPNSSYEGI